MITEAGQSKTREQQDKKNMRHRGTLAKQRFYAANADFEAFISEATIEGEKLTIRAGTLYDAYVVWKKKRADGAEPMHIRVFGLRIARRFAKKIGRSNRVTYLGVALR